VPAVLCAALVVGCGSSSGGISSADAKNLVLRASDLPDGFAPFTEGPTSTLDTQGTARADLDRFGRQGGWVARLKREGGATQAGPLVVVSTVDVFSGSRGAKSDLDAYARDFARQVDTGLAKRVAVRNLGDEAVAARVAGPGGGGSFVIAWRKRNATASVTASGFAGKLTLPDVLVLARRQEAKLARAG
jgi:hypothetical protein